MTIDEIIKTLNQCNYKHEDIIIRYNSNKEEKYRYSWKTQIIDSNTVSIYDSEWDNLDYIKLTDIYSCNSVNDEKYGNYTHREFDIIIDNLYKQFCEHWDNGDYYEAQLLMNFLNDTIKKRQQLIDSD